jgi:hypothetical protein
VHSLATEFQFHSNRFAMTSRAELAATVGAAAATVGAAAVGAATEASPLPIRAAIKSRLTAPAEPIDDVSRCLPRQSTTLTSP